MVTEEPDSLKPAKLCDPFEIPRTNVQQLAEEFDYFIFDCDGVLWHGDDQHIGYSFRNIEWLEE